MPDLFSWIAPLYDRLFRPPDREMLLWLNIRGGELVLDVGGGTGRVTSILRDAGRVIVIDPSLGMLAQAKKRGLMVCCARAEALPFASEIADVVVVVDAFHHFSDHLRAAGELMRVLKKGGRLFVEEPDITNLAVKFLALGENFLFMRSRFYNFVTLSRFFLDQGAYLVLTERRRGLIRLVISRR